MLFDPIYFIGLCGKSGLSLTRKQGMICISSSVKHSSRKQLLIDVMKIHKTELLPCLEDDKDPMQFDLFDQGAMDG